MTATATNTRTDRPNAVKGTGCASATVTGAGGSPPTGPETTPAPSHPSPDRVAGQGARRSAPARHRGPRRARRALHPQGHQGPARARGGWTGAAVPQHPAARLARRRDRAVAVEDPRQHGDRPQRDARPVRLDQRPHAEQQGVRVGHRLPRRPMAPLTQLHAPHLHQHRRQGPRHRLRVAAHDRGGAVGAPLAGQPRLRAALLALLFQYGVALHDLEIERLRQGEPAWRSRRSLLGSIWSKVRAQTLKDYVLFPLLAGPQAPLVVAGNATANLVRNVWAFTIIFCGHFPEGTAEFSEQEAENETRGGWYCARCSARRTSPAEALSHPLREPQPPDRAPPLPRHPRTPLRARSPRRSARSARATSSLTTPAPCTPSSARWCARSSGSPYQGAEVRICRSRRYRRSSLRSEPRRLVPMVAATISDPVSTSAVCAGSWPALSGLSVRLRSGVTPSRVMATSAAMLGS